MGEAMKIMYIKTATSDDPRLGFEVNRLSKIVAQLRNALTFSEVMDAY